MHLHFPQPVRRAASCAGSSRRRGSDRWATQPPSTGRRPPLVPSGSCADQRQSPPPGVLPHRQSRGNVGPGHWGTWGRRSRAAHQRGVVRGRRRCEQGGSRRDPRSTQAAGSARGRPQVPPALRGAPGAPGLRSTAAPPAAAPAPDPSRHHPFTSDTLIMGAHSVRVLAGLGLLNRCPLAPSWGRARRPQRLPAHPAPRG